MTEKVKKIYLDIGMGCGSSNLLMEPCLVKVVSFFEFIIVPQFGYLLLKTFVRFKDINA